MNTSQHPIINCNSWLFGFELIFTWFQSMQSRTSLGSVFSASHSLLPPCWQFALKWSSSPETIWRQGLWSRHCPNSTWRGNLIILVYLFYLGSDAELNVLLLSWEHERHCPLWLGRRTTNKPIWFLSPDLTWYLPGCCILWKYVWLEWVSGAGGAHCGPATPTSSWRDLVGQTAYLWREWWGACVCVCVCMWVCVCVCVWVCEYVWVCV